MNDDELEAIRRLHETPTPPAWDDRVWAYPLMVDVVWIDTRVPPPAGANRGTGTKTHAV